MRQFPDVFGTIYYNSISSNLKIYRLKPFEGIYLRFHSHRGVLYDTVESGQFSIMTSGIVSQEKSILGDIANL